MDAMHNSTWQKQCPGEQNTQEAPCISKAFDLHLSLPYETYSFLSIFARDPAQWKRTLQSWLLLPPSPVLETLQVKRLARLE